ncbi:MAG: hypothetical protein CMJ27_02925 [Phycisphaerae bacterium]|nr:hypothetical protein [Phycisphaerae bacterium]
MSSKTKNPLAQAPLDELAAELERRRAALPRLIARREKLRTELGMLDTQITALQRLDAGPASKIGVPSNRSRRTTGDKPGRVTMRSKILEVLGTAPMRPVEIAEALVDRGLHGATKSLKVQVSSTLAKFPDFERISRGQWVRKISASND